MREVTRRFDRFFENILAALRGQLQRDKEQRQRHRAAQTYSEEFGDEYIPHMRAHMTDPKERKK